MANSQSKSAVLSKIDNRVVKLLTELVGIPSINPNISGNPLPVNRFNEEAISKYLLKELRRVGLMVEIVQAEKFRPNLIATLKGTGGGPSLLINGHVDTVPVEGMKIDPFAANVTNGRLYGRGTSDMKGGVAAMVMAANAIREADIKLKGDLILAIVADEEGGAKFGTKFTIEKGILADSVIMAEPTNMRISVAEKGTFFLEITTFGRSAHGSTPEEGINAITKMAKVIMALETDLPKIWARRKHPLLGSSTMNIGVIHGGVIPNKVPDSCKIMIDRRFILDETFDMCYQEIVDVLEKLKKNDEEVSYAIRKDFQSLHFITSSEEKIVKTIREEIEFLTGSDPGYIGVPFGTDGRHYAHKGIPTITCGPGDVRQAHTEDEWIDIEQVMSATRVYALTALDYCGIA